MNINWMDKLGIIDDIYKIKYFDPVEKSIDIPLMLFDTICDSVYDDNKGSVNKYADFPTIARTLIQSKTDFGDIDNICIANSEKYSSKCVYLDRMYTEWKVTDLFSSIVCCFFVSMAIERIRSDKQRNNGIRTYFFNDKICATNIYTNDSNVVFDLTKYHGAIRKDLELDNPNYFDLIATDAAINNRFNICLIAEKNDELSEIVFPLVGYKVLIEESLRDDGEEPDVLSITFADLGLEFSINE